ncbi:MAG: transcriptional regulator [Deltaproteobacteria bacterium]|nr:transcriptional regulator [Deltaproteobacteria bacterium]
MDIQIKEIAETWPRIQNIFSVPHTEQEYLKLVKLLDGLIDEVGNEENHPLSSLMETIGSLIETYEDRNSIDLKGNSLDALKYLMEEKGLKQADLPEIGSQGIVSEILSGKRKLNLRQVKLLSERFKESPAVFI